MFAVSAAQGGGIPCTVMTAGAIERPPPRGWGFRLAAVAVTVAVEIGADAVSRRISTGEIIGIADVAAITTVVVRRSCKTNDQGAVAGAGGMGKWVDFAHVVVVTVGATAGVRSVVIAVLFTGTARRRMVAVLRRRDVTGAASGRSIQRCATPGGGLRLEMAIDIGAST